MNSLQKMTRIHKHSGKRIFFNASVVLSGLRSPAGGSAKLLRLVKHNRIKGTVSETVVDEVIRNAYKISKSKPDVQASITETFPYISPAPNASLVAACDSLVTDAGDAHILASCKETKADFLVTLDQKHLLALQKKIRWVKIVSPKELLEYFNRK